MKDKISVGLLFVNYTLVLSLRRAVLACAFPLKPPR